MFNYLFPIFCFGLVITGIVLLGLLEAAKQVKVESRKERDPEAFDINLNPVSSRNGHATRFAARTVHE